jgi:hypothetical protein
MLCPDFLFKHTFCSGGLAWIKSFNVGMGICAILVHVVAIFLDPYYWSMLVYIRQHRTKLSTLYNLIVPARYEYDLRYQATQDFNHSFAILAHTCRRCLSKYILSKHAYLHKVTQDSCQ